jgi:peptidyl-prolyl cis-trans isomerase D
MLRKLHNKAVQKKIWIVLTILILPAFLVWGTSSSVRARKERKSYGSIFGKSISFEEYFGALKTTEAQTRMQFGEAYSELMKYLSLDTLAWQRLVLLYEAKKRGIRASDSEVIASIAKDPAFQRNGQFDDKLYATIIQYSLRLHPREFEELNRQNMIMAKLTDLITKGVTIPLAEIKEAYKKENEKLSVYYLAAVPADFAKELVPGDEELKNYFSQKTPDFKQPLSFNLEYLAVEAKDKIDGIALRLDKKESLEAVAKDYNLALKETGLFGQTDAIPGIGWQREISDLLIKFKTGEILPVQEIDKRFYILRVKERKEPYIPEYEKVKDKVKEAFIKNKSRDIAKEKIEQCLKKLKDEYALNPKEIDFDKAAKEFGLKSSATDLFKFGSYIESIGGSDKIFSAANNLKEGDFSEVIEMPSGFYIVKLKSKEPVDEKKFAADKEAFSKKLLAQKKEEFFNKFLEELLKKTHPPS